MVYMRTWCPDWRLLSSVHLGHGDFLGQVQDATGPRWKDFGFLGHLVAQVPPPPVQYQHAPPPSLPLAIP